MDVGVLLHGTCGPSLSSSVKMETSIRLSYHYVWLIMLGVKALPIRPGAITTTSQTKLPTALGHSRSRRRKTPLHSITALGDYLESVLNSKQNYLPRPEKRVQEPLPWIAQHSSPSSCLDLEVDTFADQS
jgi:hypothetical protein